MRQHIKFFILFPIFWIVVCGAFQGFAATPTVNAGDEKLWDHGGAYLIVALLQEVAPVAQEPNEAATHILTLKPICTLAGEFDPSKNPEIRARAWMDEKHVKYGRSSMAEIPPKGATVLVLIMPGNIGDDARRPFPWVAPDICSFMPEEFGLVVLKDLNDSQITETLDRVRKARTHGEVVFPPDAKATGRSRG